MSDTTYPVFKANIILKGKIKCLTGLHIGGSKEKLDIGGVDSPVLRNPQTNYPYIPGSSLKGKLRSLLEYSTPGALLKVGKKSKIGDVSHHIDIVRLFGIGANDKEEAENNSQKNSDGNTELAEVGPTRIIVRDSNPDKYTIDLWETIDSELLYTEFKPENTIDRITSAANPRFIERVVADSRFDFEIIYGVYQISNQSENESIQKDLTNLLKAMRLLENSFLGKSGTRGYGQVKFYLTSPFVVEASDYANNTEKYQNSNQKIDENIDQLYTLANLPEIPYAD